MTPSETLSGIRDGNYHAGGIRCLRIHRLDERGEGELRAEVTRLCERERPSDVRSPDHVTSWTRPRGEVLQFSLLNTSARCDDFSDDHDLSPLGKRFHHGADYPSLARFIDGLPHLVNFRINVLGPNARLSPHEEHSIIRTREGSIGAITRFHLPVVTNPAAELTLDGEVFHLEAGVIHYINHGCVHAARNGGAERRIHLVWDMLLTRAAWDATFGAPARIDDGDRAPSPRRTERMGAYLKLPPPVSREEAEQLELCPPWS